MVVLELSVCLSSGNLTSKMSKSKVEAYKLYQADPAIFMANNQMKCLGNDCAKIAWKSSQKTCCPWLDIWLGKAC